MSQRFRPALSFFLVCPLLSACVAGEGAPAGPRAVDGLSVTVLASPAAAGSGEPNLFAGPGGVHMSWLEPTGEPQGWVLRFATRRDDGWSPPRTIVENLPFFVNWADFPSVVQLRDGALVAHWLQMSAAGTYDYEVRIARSDDNGRSWSESRVLHRDGVAAEHGFVTLVPDPDGGLDAVWLDGRETRPSEPGREPGPMTLRTTSLSVDGSLGDERLLDPRICDCCQTDAAWVGDRLVAVYRDRSPQEIRDIYAVSRDAQGNWTEPVRVAADAWQIPGCPVNGPAIAAQDDLGAVAWFSMVAGAPEVKVAFTRDGGRSFEPPVILERGDAAATTLGRVDARWLDDATLVVTWLTALGDSAEIRYRTVSRDGRAGAAGVVATTHASRSSGFPRMARLAPGRLLLAFRIPGDDGGIEVRELTPSSADAGASAAATGRG